MPALILSTAGSRTQERVAGCCRCSTASRGISTPLRVVLGGGAPDERVGGVRRQRLVDLAAQRAHGDAATIGRQHDRVRKVRLAAHLRMCPERGWMHPRLACAASARRAARMSHPP